jgi:chorismate mutase/prephenate dehydratase
MARNRTTKQLKLVVPQVSAGASSLPVEAQIREVRKEIDRIDEGILRMIHARVEEVVKIGKIKGSSEGTTKAIYRPEREKYILERLAALNGKSVFPNRAMEVIFREIISACRSIEAPIHVAYFGMPASYTHQAAQEVFGSSASYTSGRTVNDVFDEVESEKSAYGVLPIENSTEGVVTPTLDRLLSAEVSIIAETYLDIHHCLLSNEKKIQNIKKIYSHPQPFAQCRATIARYCPGAQLVETASTSEAARLTYGKKGIAAIASKKSAEAYKLPILLENIEDHPDNVTRFVVVTKNGKTVRTGSDRTSLLFSIRDEPGSLEAVLQILASHKINMSKIVSRPSRKKAFEYSFFIDIDGHFEDKNVVTCLQVISKKTSALKILGSYPKVNRSNAKHF